MKRLLARFALIAVVLVVPLYAAGGWYFASRIDSGALAVQRPADRTVEAVEVASREITVRETGEDPPALEKDMTYGLVWDGGHGEVSGPPVEVAGPDDDHRRRGAHRPRRSAAERVHPVGELRGHRPHLRPEHRLSVVLYLSQHIDRAGVEDMADLTGTMVDLVLAHGGTFYLPYQQHYTPAQLRRGYPQIGEFFALKRRYDPAELLVNNLSARYANQPPSEAPSLTPLPRDAGSRAPASTDNCSTGALPCHVSSASPGDVRRRGRTAQAPERAT